ncbi:hypothetical protein [Caldisericum sp. AR60]|uniref:hypothetical protein n=1 Tax=Caldisericum sp. AR60 TaxID=3397852 RepID=UPI0039FD5FC9
MNWHIEDYSVRDGVCMVITPPEVVITGAMPQLKQCIIQNREEWPPEGEMPFKTLENINLILLISKYLCLPVYAQSNTSYQLQYQ